ncbi:MAG: hypothetical protein LBQ50_03690 [Planctomycetaceae bacterium]|nr:hypothetical protein [Planctomycetaceae bacterium]
MSDVQVLMRPTDPLVKWSIGGTTNIDGTLEVLTHGVHLGAPAGEYKILLVKQEEEESQYSKIPPSDPTALAQWEENISKEKLGNYSVIDQKYSDVTTTPFIITIKKQKKNSIKCDVGVLVRKRIN